MRQAVLFVTLLLTICGSGLTQRAGVPRRGPGGAAASGDPQFEQRRNDSNPDIQRMERDRDKRLNKERQAAIQRDTDKLLSLATELKQYVDKTNENVLSLEVMKKAEEIEKLAHQVKEKMKSGR
ncbi:MAG: hypothetical protein LAN64_11840 [Acidobacteriia bacterium]|nr:hypothetical protein [Terriglobia bacterium]